MEKNLSDDGKSSPDLRPYALRRFDETPGAKVVVSQAESPEVRLKRRESEAEERGYQAGIAKAEAEIKGRVDEVVNRLAGVISQLQQHAVLQAEELAPQLIALAVEIAEKVIHKALEVDREIVVAIAHDALRKVADTGEQIVIQVNPADFSLINERLGQLKDDSGLKGIIIEPVESISPGGCYIEARTGAVDARIEEQLREADDAVRTALNS